MSERHPRSVRLVCSYLPAYITDARVTGEIVGNDQGIGISTVDLEGETKFVISLRKKDGTALAAFLTEFSLQHFANLLASAVEAVNAAEQPKFGELG